jgi:hypothetical protein
VKGSAGTAITLAWNAEKAKRIESALKLGESTLPAAGPAK